MIDAALLLFTGELELLDAPPKPQRRHPRHDWKDKRDAEGDECDEEHQLHWRSPGHTWPC